MTRYSIIGFLIVAVFSTGWKKKDTVAVARELIVSPSEGGTADLSIGNRIYPSYNLSAKAPDSTGMGTAVQSNNSYYKHPIY